MGSRAIHYLLTAGQSLDPWSQEKWESYCLSPLVHLTKLLWRPTTLINGKMIYSRRVFLPAWGLRLAALATDVEWDAFIPLSGLVLCWVIEDSTICFRKKPFEKENMAVTERHSEPPLRPKFPKRPGFYLSHLWKKCPKPSPNPALGGNRK